MRKTCHVGESREMIMGVEILPESVRVAQIPSRDSPARHLTCHPPLRRQPPGAPSDITQIFEGTNQIQRLVISRSLDESTR
jgi:hypothetical protein